MSDETGAPAGGEAVAIVEAPANTGTNLSVSQAARALAAARHRPKEQNNAPVEPQAPVEQNELAQANADPAQQAPGEETDAAEPAENLPPIEPPRSWTQAEKDRFQSLPRETQEYLHTREQERDREFRRGQNETAEKSKALEAKLAEVEQARQKYATGLAAQDSAFERESAEKFPNIKSMADIEFLANEQVRLANEGNTAGASQIQAYLTAWQTHQNKWAQVRAERNEAERQQATERNTKWANHVHKENAKAAELIPDLADKEKGPALMNRASGRLAELGFGQDELGRLARGEEKISIFDHRLQQLIFSDLTLQDIQKAKASVAAKPLPPVQRPGTAKPQGNASSERLQVLNNQLTESGSLKAAQALRAAQIASRRR